MPFIAELDGERVIPEQVQKQTTVVCLTCGGQMRLRGPSENGRARHFYHLGRAESCSGGESDQHRKLKSVAVSALRAKFDGEYSRCAPEVSLNVIQTNSKVDQRRADAFLEFEQEHTRYRKGLIIEIQYRNKGKAIPATTRDYLDCGYSVYWAQPSDFNETQFQFGNLESAFKADNSFAYSPLLSGDVDEFDETDLLWEDPLSDCDHVWKTVGDIEVCARCRINRTYSNTRTRFLYDNMGILGPLDRDAVPNLPEKWESLRTTDTGDKKSNSETSSEKARHYSMRNLPHGVPEECPHYNGPDHQWQDYGWADQAKAKCLNCNTVVEKAKLPNSVHLERF
jgi:hypothetical protein